MRSLSPVDWTILEYLSAEPQPAAALVGPLPRGSLYRHLGHLRAAGLVVKSGRGYALTSTGLAQRADRAQGQAWEAMTRVYPSLHEVPTPQHRALLELMLAAAVIRQYCQRPWSLAVTEARDSTRPRPVETDSSQRNGFGGTEALLCSRRLA